MCRRKLCWPFGPSRPEFNYSTPFAWVFLGKEPPISHGGSFLFLYVGQHIASIALRPALGYNGSRKELEILEGIIVVRAKRMATIPSAQGDFNAAMWQYYPALMVNGSYNIITEDGELHTITNDTLNDRFETLFMVSGPIINVQAEKEALRWLLSILGQS